MKKWKTVVILLLIICLLTGCSSIRSNDNGGTAVGTGPLAEFRNGVLLDEKSGRTAPASRPEENADDRIVVRADGIGPGFNPFFPRGTAGALMSALTGVTLLGTARGGETVLTGAAGQTTSYGERDYTYAGIADVRREGKTYVVTLRDDVYFSDGVNLTADDVIFSMYVLADPAYRGSCAFSELPIRGLKEYRGSMRPKWEWILQSLADGGKQPEGVSEEEYDSFLTAFREAGLEFLEPVITSCTEDFAGEYSEYVLGVTPGELRNSRGLQVAFAEYFWDIASGRNETGLWEENDGKTYDLRSEFPTGESFWELIVRERNYDVGDNGINYMKMGETDFLDLLSEKMEETCASLFLAVGDDPGAASISGIRKTGLYGLQVTMTQPLGEDISKLNIPVCPLHHYGEEENYDYRARRFGFTKGDLSGVLQNGRTALGAGPFQILRERDGIVLLGANGLYYEGEPAAANLMLTDKTMNCDLRLSDTVPTVGTYGSVEVETETYTGIGFHVDRVRIGEDSLSESSCQFRRALAETVKAFAAGETEDLWSVTAPILAGAGFSVDSVRVTEMPEGAPQELMIRVYGSGGPETALREAGRWLKEHGLPVTVEETTSKAFVSSYAREGSSDVWIMSVNDPWRTGAAGLFSSEGSDHLFRLESEQVDRLLEQAAAEPDQETRNSRYQAAREELEKLWVFVPLEREQRFLLLSDKIDRASLPTDMTDHYGWYSQAHTVRLRG